MQQPTCSGMCVRTTDDAKKIFEAVFQQRLPIITRRLDAEEKRRLAPGQVFVWEERSSNPNCSSSTGIERWTDSIHWAPSRVKDEFLFYDEKERQDTSGTSLSVGTFTAAFSSSALRNLVKQTYSVWVRLSDGYRKWHITAYTTTSAAKLDRLYTVDDHPDYPFLSRISFPPEKYTSARGPAGAHIAPPRPSPMRSPESPVEAPLGKPGLAPLEFLTTVPPPRRHPIDEEAIMSFPIYEYLACHQGRKLEYPRSYALSALAH